MTAKSSFVALTLFACVPAYGATDTRIRTEAYSPNQIVRIVGKAGIQSTIEFGDDERIENVAVGDSAAWQITPNHRASLLFVKPLTAHSRTNMTVVTDRRTYMFDLVAGDKGTTPLYAMKFSYPNEKAAEPVKPVQQVAVADHDCRKTALRLEHQGQRQAVALARVRRRRRAVPLVEP